MVALLVCVLTVLLAPPVARPSVSAMLPTKNQHTVESGMTVHRRLSMRNQRAGRDLYSLTIDGALS
jgi:hypothetical protein